MSEGHFFLVGFFLVLLVINRVVWAWVDRAERRDREKHAERS